MTDVMPILDYTPEVQKLIETYWQPVSKVPEGTPVVALSFNDIVERIKQVFPVVVSDNMIYEVLTHLGYRPEPKTKGSFEFVWKFAERQ